MQISSKLKNWLKQFRFVRRVYSRYKNYLPVEISTVPDSITEITPFTFRKSAIESIRLNLLVPSISQEHIFGGISTALKFFDQLRSAFDTDARIIVTDAAPSAKDMNDFSRYHIVSCDDPDQAGQLIIPFNDRYNRSIPVARHDIFIATSWWTAYNGFRTLSWQDSVYNCYAPLVYIIQDFEPGFYPWSSQYLLADSTYRSKYDTYAVFNSMFLANYFTDHHYSFNRIYSFEPQLHDRLKEVLTSYQKQGMKKLKHVLIYGRPSVARNAFTLIIESLKRWVWMQPDIQEWEIVSVGENHPSIDLGNGKHLKSVGKLTIDQYADTLAESSVGISLMVSPHPSYPPMEMAVFGMGVITNRYDNKDLSLWHSNIRSLDICDPDLIAQALLQLCTRASEVPDLLIHGTLQVQDYLAGKNQFHFIADIRASILKDLGVQS